MSEYRIFYFLTFFIFGSWSLASSDYTPSYTTRDIPPETPEPTDIETANAEDFNPDSYPLILEGNGGNETAFVYNTGFSIELILRNAETTETAEGAIVDGKNFVFFKFRCYWTNGTENKAAYNTIDGKNGSHLEVVMQYYNTDYSSFREALKHRDGILKIDMSVPLGTEHNPLFDYFGNATKKVPIPGQSYDIPLSKAYAWFYPLPRDIRYLVIPGSYSNESRAEMFFCATSLVFELPKSMGISHKQFEEAFLENLVDRNGEPLTNFEHRFPFNNRPVARVRDIITRVNRNKAALPSRLSNNS